MSVNLYRYQGDNKFRPINGGGVLDVTGGSGDPGEEPTPPDVDPPPTSWQNAVDSRNIDTVRAWYAANTGHEALGYNEEDLTWVSGGIKSTHDGQVIEGVASNHIRIAHNNVTIRGCRIVGGATYGLYYNPTFGANITGCVVEYCTFDRNEIEHTAADAKSIAMIRPEYTTARSLTFRNNNCFGWGGGVRLGNHVWAEYNWVHDAQYPGDAHLNMMRVQDVGGTLLRNYLDGGRSGTCSIYFDKEPTHNITYQENVLYNTSSLGAPSYHILFKSGDYGPTATNIKIIGNYFGLGYQYGLYGGGNVPWGTNGNERTGNVNFVNGDPVMV